MDTLLWNDEKSKQIIFLYEISEIINKYDKDDSPLESILTDVTNIIPHAMQNPANTSARLIVNPILFTTEDFRTSEKLLKAGIKCFGSEIGSIEIFDLSEPAGSPGFINQEKVFVKYLSDKIGRLVERLRTRQRLEEESRMLKDTNTTLKEVLRRIQEEKEDVGHSIQSQVSHLIMPMIDNLSGLLDPRLRAYMKLLSTSLNDIFSPYSSGMDNLFMKLTPQEIQICNMIKNGMTSKDISTLQGLSVMTINKHRENIRKKLNLTNNKINLKTFLINNIPDTSGF